MVTTTEDRPRLAALLSMREAAAALGLKADTAADLARRGQFPGAVRLGGRWYVSRRQLALWLASAGAPTEPAS